MCSNLSERMEDPSLVCRGCLATSGEMKNMIEWNLAEDFYKLTNIKIHQSDELSELLCLHCEEIIAKCRSFASQCSRADLFLRSFKESFTKNSTSVSSGTCTEDNTASSAIKGKIVIISITAPKMEPKILLPCPKCPEKFLKRTDLQNHIKKIHNENLTIDIRFYCTKNDCAYFEGSEKKFFTGRKYLNQHILKVHQNKYIFCHSCKLNFFDENDYNRHLKTCGFIYICQVCTKDFKTNERLLVHLLRKHPELHEQYKTERKSEKRKQSLHMNSKKLKSESDTDTCDSPKRSFATQTLLANLKNDVTLSWQPEKFGTKKDEISTQTVFEDCMSIKSQNEDDSIFFSETVSLSDIQTQTIPLEFGLSRSNKETITSQTQTQDLSMKETQTCLCLSKPFKCDILNTFCTTSTETQTFFDDELLKFNSTETQTSLDDLNRDL